MTIRHRLLIMLLLLLAMVLGSLGLTPPAKAQESVSVPVTVVVRDSAGTPLVGVQLDIQKENIPLPPEPVETCFTDQSGQCPLTLNSGYFYILVFAGSWQGYPFISAEEQVPPPGTSETPASGFSFFLDGTYSSTLYVTFVVGQQAGSLVPYWDGSRDPNASPVPLGYPDEMEGLQPLLTVAPISEDATPGMAPTPLVTQVIIDVYGQSNEPTPTATTTLATATTTPSPEPVEMGFGSMGSGYLCIGALVVLGIGYWVVHTIRARRRTK